MVNIHIDVAEDAMVKKLLNRKYRAFGSREYTYTSVQGSLKVNFKWSAQSTELTCTLSSTINQFKPKVHKALFHQVDYLLHIADKWLNTESLGKSASDAVGYFFKATPVFTKRTCNSLRDFGYYSVSDIGMMLARLEDKNEIESWSVQPNDHPNSWKAVVRYSCKEKPAQVLGYKNNHALMHMCDNFAIQQHIYRALDVWHVSIYFW